MVWMIVSLLVAGYGVLYAANPRPYLQRRMNRKDVPARSIQTARCVGVVLVVLGLASAALQAFSLGLVG